MEYSEWFALRLRTALGEMSQADLIKILAENGFEMTQARLSHYMQGRNYPDPPVLKELARAIEVSADYLLGLTEQKLPVADLEEMIANVKGEGRIDRLMRKLSREQRHQAVAYIEYLLVQSGRAEEIARSNAAGAEAAMNVFQRKHGKIAADDLLDLLADNFPELHDLLGSLGDERSVDEG